MIDRSIELRSVVVAVRTSWIRARNTWALVSWLSKTTMIALLALPDGAADGWLAASDFMRRHNWTGDWNFQSLEIRNHSVSCSNATDRDPLLIYLPSNL